jgi:hypothetical protein
MKSASLNKRFAAKTHLAVGEFSQLQKKKKAGGGKVKLSRYRPGQAFGVPGG